MLILLPNQAYKLNSPGLYLLKRTLEGKPVREVLEDRTAGLSSDERAVADVHEFFCDLRALVMGCLGEGEGRRAVEVERFQRPHNSLPVLSEVALTYRCNLACRFCYAGCRCKREGGHGGPTLRSEMTTEQVRRVLDVIRLDAEVPSVSWTGGEPTLRDDLAELTAYATGLGMRVNLITNGTLLDEQLVRDLRGAGLRSAQVSLEAPDAQTHDGLTQVPGSFERTVRGIALLRDAGLHVHTNTTLNRVNAPIAGDMVDLTRTLGTKRFSMNLVIPCGSAIGSDVTLTYTEAAEIIDRVRRRARDAGVEFMWYSPTPYCIFNPVAARLGGKSCAACDGLLSVAPNGDVLPCSSVPKGVGNLLRKPFERVWNSRRARYWRGKQYAHRTCRGCRHFDICTGACPIYWDAMGYGELTEAAGRVTV